MLCIHKELIKKSDYDKYFVTVHKYISQKYPDSKTEITERSVDGEPGVEIKISKTIDNEKEQLEFLNAK